MRAHKTIIARINSFSLDDLDELLSLILEIERKGIFGKPHPKNHQSGQVCNDFQ